MSIQSTDPTGTTRAGYVWVDGKDGVPAHWERERATPPPADPPPPGATTKPDDVKAPPPPSSGDHDDHDHDHHGKKHKKHHKDDDDDHDHHGKKHKKHHKDDDDHDHHGKKHKKHDKDDDHRDKGKEDDHDPGKSETPPPTQESTPPATPSTPPPGPAPQVRDHRGDNPADAPGGVTVTRDHRGQGTPIVRDHRGEDVGGTPVVRDHRGTPPAPPVQNDPGPTVRDHRGEDVAKLATPAAMMAAGLDEFADAPPPSQAAPQVRDHREPPPEPQVRDHREPPPQPQVRDHREGDLVGDESVAAKAMTPGLIEAAPAVAATALHAQVNLDDWESHGAVTETHGGTSDVTLDSFDDRAFTTEDADAFAVDDLHHDPDPMAADPAMSDHRE